MDNPTEQDHLAIFLEAFPFAQTSVQLGPCPANNLRLQHVHPVAPAL